jgi:hypothetical protein
MIAAAWPWVLAGIAFVVVAGLAFVVLVGVAGLPGDFLRRLGQSASAGRSERGGVLPDEVPDDTDDQRP